MYFVKFQATDKIFNFEYIEGHYKAILQQKVQNPSILIKIGILVANIKIQKKYSIFFLKY